jgi:hypothetical protein
VITAGMEVMFPNSDSVSHHVYSFSASKRFELPLYKGSVYPPERFDEPGLVVIGCNIHDDMLGYILVLETPFFARTDGDGLAAMRELPEGRYTVRVWTPRSPADELPEAVELTLRDNMPQELELAFSGRLYPPHASDKDSLTWTYY